MNIIKRLLSVINIKTRLKILKLFRNNDELKHNHYYVLSMDKLQVYKYIGYGSITDGTDNINLELVKYDIFIHTGVILNCSILNLCKIDSINTLPTLVVPDKLNDFIFNADNFLLTDMVISTSKNPIIPISIYKKNNCALFELIVPFRYTNTIYNNKFIWKLCSTKIFFELEN